jgi:hypothetical protein
VVLHLPSSLVHVSTFQNALKVPQGCLRPALPVSHTLPCLGHRVPAEPHLSGAVHLHRTLRGMSPTPSPSTSFMTVLHDIFSPPKYLPPFNRRLNLAHLAYRPPHHFVYTQPPSPRGGAPERNITIVLLSPEGFLLLFLLLLLPLLSNLLTAQHPKYLLHN